MKYETIKSILLIFLVALSGILTWNLWTYQPKYEVIEKKSVHEVSISETKDTVDIVRPLRILFHDGQKHYGTVNDREMNMLLQEMASWNFYDLGDSISYNYNQLYGSSEIDQTIELIFPDIVPFHLYKNILHFETENLPADFFNRMIIQLDKDAKDGFVYFVNTEAGTMYETHVNQEYLFTLLRGMEERLNVYDPYELEEFGNQKKYLRAEEINLPVYKYYVDYIDPEKFQNALFSDPIRVRRDMFVNGEKFTDGSSLMNVDYDTGIMFYINPIQEPDPGTRPVSWELLKNSIDFVNEHGGWTDHYRYFDTDINSQKTIFRLFKKGYPVFNEDGMAEIRQNWGKSEIYQYRRPYFSLDISLPNQATVNLPSGKKVLEALASSEKINIEMIEDVIIGYKLSKDPDNSKVLVLEPAWYYLYAGSWLPFDPEGGMDSDGLG